MFKDRSAKVLLLQCPDPGAITHLSLISWLQGSTLLGSAPSDWVLVRKKREHANPYWVFKKIYLLIYFIFWLWWVFMVALRLSLLMAS